MLLVLGEHFLGVKGVLEILLEVDCLPECIDYQPVHDQKYLYGCLTELEMYQILEVLNGILFCYIAKT